MAQRERIVVLYNELVLPEEHPDYVSEIEVLDNVEAVTEVLTEAGFEVEQFAAPDEPARFIDGLRELRPDAVVNLFEGSANFSANEMYAAGLLEWLGVSYTGCPFHTLVIARSKHLAKRLFLAEGISTAPFLVVDRPVRIDHVPFPFPVIVKPAQQDASVGVEQESVATDLASLNHRVAHVLEQFGGPVLVEEFIRGRELTVALVEMPDLRLLPGTEVVFPDAGPDYWPILSYHAKWTRGHAEFETTDYHFKAELTGQLAEDIERYARKAFAVLGARDYARVDFRIRDGKPYVLELNPNPDFAPDRAMSNNLWAAGLTHGEFTVQLVRNALARRGDTGPARYRDRDRREAS